MTNILMPWIYLNILSVCIFMNIIYNVENWGKNHGKTIAVERFLVDYKIFLAFKDKFSWLQVWSEGPLKCCEILSLTRNIFA